MQQENLKEKLEKNLKSSLVPSRVLEICKKYPGARGDYRILLWRYLRDFHGCTMSFNQAKSFFEALRSSPSPETIGRAWRKLAHDGKAKLKELKDAFEVTPTPEIANKIKEQQEYLKYILPTEKTLEKRRLNEKIHREFFSPRRLADYEAD